MTKYISISVFCTLLFCVKVKAGDFIVSNLKEFEEVAFKAKAGNVIVWKEGKYENIKINFRANGNAENPIILKAQTDGKVSFSGNSQILLSGNYLQVKGFLFEGKCTLEDKEHVISFSSSGKEAHHSKIINKHRLLLCG